MNDQRAAAAEMLAYTVGQLFPNVLFAGGGVTKHGFYYDFIFEQDLYSEMLSLIEVNTRSTIKENIEIQSLSMMRENAVSLLNHHHQPFLAEKAEAEAFNVIHLVKIKDYYGVSQAPNCASDEIGSIKLLGLEEKLLLTSEGEISVMRLTGTSFPNPQALKKFVKAYDAYLKKKDHRHLGIELGFFSVDHDLGSLQPLWHPKGTLLKQILKDLLATHQKQQDYQVVESPAIIKADLFKDVPDLLSFSIDEDSYCLAPHCLPQHLRLLKKIPGSPLRLFEYPTVHQPVSESQRWGLMNYPSYLSDMMTIRCSKKEVLGEMISSLQFIEQIIRMFSFQAYWVLVRSKSGTPRARGEKEAVSVLESAQAEASCHYPLVADHQEEEHLLGPRLELRLVDELERQWPAGALTIVKQDIVGDSVITRSVWGSLDRFVGLLIERFEGVFPLWLAPEQVRVLSVGQTNDYARSVYEGCQKQSLRVGIDLVDEKLGSKIHAAEREKIPYLIIVGDQEVRKECVTVRSIQQAGKSHTIKLDQFFDQIHQELRSQTVNGENLI